MERFLVYYINYIIILFILTKPQLSNAQLIAIEGQNVNLVFVTESKNDVNFELQYKDNPPFYTNKQIVYSMLTKDQQSRLIVKETRYSDRVKLYLTILNVSRYDAGEYRCLVDTIILKDADLSVDYPPANVHCAPLPLRVKDYVATECFAEAGYIIQGYILCFQNDQLALTKTELFSNVTILYKQLWVKENVPFQCCTSLKADTVYDDSSCKEYFNPNYNTSSGVGTTQVYNDRKEGYDSRITVTLVLSSISFSVVCILVICIVRAKTALVNANRKGGQSQLEGNMMLLLQNPEQEFAPFAELN